MTQKYISLAATAALLVTVLFGNYVTDRFGLIPVGFGLTATAGIYLAGATFVLRDTLQDAAGKRVTVAIIAVAAGLSFLVADASRRCQGVEATWGSPRRSRSKDSRGVR